MEKKEVVIGSPIRQGKIIINGKVETRNVYKVNINCLYYNDKNGRIATFMSSYKAENNSDISELDFESYNDRIMQFIIKSESKDIYKSTKDNIGDIGQLKAGVILEDGRVIDGNRRFTCLRDLYKETGKEQYMYFECFVLPVPHNLEEEKAIKSLELSAQYGSTEKVSYNPVDYLANIYQYLIGPEKLFTPMEYVARMNGTSKESEVKDDMLEAETMWDYLEFINQKGRWDIARDLKLEGPIHELVALRKREKENWANIAQTFYMKLNKTTEGDKTRSIRQFVKLYKEKPYEFEEIKRRFLGIALQDELIKREKDEAKRDDLIQKRSEENDSVNREITSQITKMQLEDAQNKQLKDFNDIKKKIDSIDKMAIALSKEEIKQNIGYKIDEIIVSLQEIKKKL